MNRSTTGALSLCAMTTLLGAQSSQAHDPGVAEPWRVPIHTLSSDPVGGEYGFWAAGPSYKASFDDGVTYFPVLGPINSDLDDAPSDDANPENGIALDEIFSYEIIQRDARIDVILRRGDETGPIIGHNYVDMREQSSGYDVPQEWMYFKAGAYSQNNTGDGTDFDRVTFYRLEKSHD